MIKGVNHTIIEVSNPCNRYFDRALLFVRPQLEAVSSGQLQSEADRLIETIGNPPMHRPLSNNVRKSRKRKRIIVSCFWWLIGIGCGLLLAGVF